MKKLIAMLLALVMVLSLCACNKKDDGAAEEEKETAYLLTEVVMTSTDDDGKAHTMKANLEYDDDYNVIGLKSYEDGELVYERTFNKDIEKPLLDLGYDEDGEVNDRTEYTYDDKGNLLECKGSYTYGGVTTTFREVCTYDGNGNKLTEKSYRNGELDYEYTYTYTATGNVATEIYISSSGYKSHYTYSYDEHDNVVSVKEEYKHDGEVSSYELTYENTYENGKIVKHVSNLGTDTYTYNSAGKITEYSYTSSEGNTKRMTCTYDDNGMPIGVKHYEGGEVRMEYTLTYKEVEVSKETAEKIEAIVEKLGMFDY